MKRLPLLILLLLLCLSFRLSAQEPAPDREVDALYAVLRLLAFGLGSISLVAAEYHAITWLLARS